MDALEQLALTGQVSFRAVRSTLRRPLVWVALAAFTVPAVAALTLANFAHPLLSPLMFPLVRALGGEEALHYPGVLVMLPALMERLGRMTNWLLLTLLLGWAGAVAAQGAQRVPVRSALLATLGRPLRLLLVGAPLVILHTLAAMMSAAALANLSHQLISALAHLMAASAIEVIALGLGMLVLPLLVRQDLSVGELWGALARAFHWGTVASLGFGVALAAAALASRIVFLRAGQILVTRYPDAVLAVVWCAQLVTALGIAVFASASVVLATALDEGWE